MEIGIDSFASAMYGSNLTGAEASNSARHFGLICATFGGRPDSFRFVLCQ
ncbi:hypothetical protein [Sinomicrobium oceani]|nr:hypothetical protein [Sinomicrobium oceani]